jgi:hypothetical protein
VNPGGPSSWPGRAFGICLTLLAAAVALWWAVRLVEQVWLPLLAIGVGVGALVGLIGLARWWHGRQSGW